MTEKEFEHTAQRMRPQLIKLGHSFFDDGAQAEDVAQEALVRLWLLRDKVDAVVKAEALLVRMTKNICVSLWREQRQRMASIADSIALTDVQPMADDDNVRMLQLAISRLTPSEQKLFRMRQELDMDIPQIAATTGIHPRSVSVIISNARKNIIEQLKKGGIL